MKKIYYLSIGIVMLTNIHSQTSHNIDINNIDARITASPVLFYDDGTSTSEFSCPQMEGFSTIFASSIWMGGMGINSQLSIAGDLYGTNGTDFAPGPLPYDQATAFANYDRVFPITKSEIDQFVGYNACANDPNCDETILYPNYVIPTNILDWPAHGDLSFNQTYHLAPFIDVNNDGLYEPNNGDYPCIKGDEAVYYIMNDLGIAHTATGGDPVGAEVHVMVYAFESDSTSPLYNTLFVNYKIINRGINSFTDFKMGVYTDLDIGYGDNDYVGTFVDENTVFGYNGVLNDVGGTGATGLISPAQGVTFLSHNLNSSMFFFRADQAPNYGGDPNIAIEYYNYMDAKWLDGTSLTYGGNGHGGTTTTKYAFPQVPPSGSAVWTEVSENNPPSDRRILGSIKEGSFAAGDTISLDVAYIWSRSTQATPSTSVAKLQTDAQAIQQFYDNQLLSCYDSQGDGLSISENKTNLNVYPTISSNIVNFEFETSISGTLTLFDATGKIVLQKTINGAYTTINIEDKPSGFYLYSIHSDNEQFNGKILKD